MLFQSKCFKFFYGVFKVGLNTQQNSSAAHCPAIQNYIVKLNLNSAEIALSKPVSSGVDKDVYCVCTHKF